MRSQYVPAGDYSIFVPGEKVQLVALLGTCVGVALLDCSAGVGGICHILLSEPNDPNDVWQPKNYASTSLPIFVDELLKKGAHRDRLEAVIAGGSLSAPFSGRDLNMDIGGRNAEAALGFLNRQGIPISRAETGGCYAMNLTLDSTSCKVEITHVMQGMAETPSAIEPETPTRDEIELAITELKPIPQVALKLIRLLRSDDYDLETISRELQGDQVMSAKLLSFCNSAYFGFTQEIDSVDRAILHLGGKYLIEAIVSTAVDSFYEQEGGLGGYTLIKGGMFRHSTGVANLAKVISRLSGREDEETAYTAGLLHDIGKVVLDRFVSKAQPLFYAMELDKVDDIIQLEQKHFRCDHQTIGRKLAKMWELPGNLKEVISYHHTPGRAKKYRDLTCIIHIADILASLVMAGVEIEKIQMKSFQKCMAEVGISSSIIPEIIAQVPWNRLMYS